MKLSVVTTLYRSAPYLVEFHRRIQQTAGRITDDFELIFVNDGSPDNSLEIALELCESDPRLKVIDLSRNFGHHRAIMTGLGQATGERVFLIDCDLEEDPELLADFFDRMEQGGADVVYGVQNSRAGSAFQRFSGELFYRLFNALSEVKIPTNLATVRLMTGDYVRSLVRHREQELFLAGLFELTGYRQEPYRFDRQVKGNSTYTLRRKLSLMVNAISSFSNKPLIAVFYIGTLTTLLSSLVAVGLVIHKVFFGGNLLTGWVSVMVSIWFLSGLVILCLGLIGIYLSRIFVEVKQRPYSIIKRIHGRN